MPDASALPSARRPPGIGALLSLIASVSAALALFEARGAVSALGGVPPEARLLVTAAQWALWSLGLYAASVGAATSACALAGRRAAARTLLRAVPAALRPTMAAVLGVSLAAAPSAPAAAATPDRPPAPVATSTTADPFDWTGARLPLVPPTVGRTVRVRPGDCLWSLVARTRHTSDPRVIATDWPRWYAANRSTIGPDPGAIRPGQLFLVPPPTATSPTRSPS
jgi:hypothetical protein